MKHWPQIVCCSQTWHKLQLSDFQSFPANCPVPLHILFERDLIVSKTFSLWGWEHCSCRCCYSCKINQWQHGNFKWYITYNQIFSMMGIQKLPMPAWNPWPKIALCGRTLLGFLPQSQQVPNHSFTDHDIRAHCSSHLTWTPCQEQPRWICFPPRYHTLNITYNKKIESMFVMHLLSNQTILNPVRVSYIMMILVPVL